MRYKNINLESFTFLFPPPARDLPYTRAPCGQTPDVTKFRQPQNRQHREDGDTVRSDTVRIPPCTATTHLYLIMKLLPSKHEFFYYVLLLLLKYGVTEIAPTSKVPVPSGL